MRKSRNSIRIGIVALSVFFSLMSVLDSASWGNQGRMDAADILKQYKSFSAFPPSASWGKAAPSVKTIKIKSSADGAMQPALFYDSETDCKKPLLVVLHSWSEDYRQKYSIPYAAWAIANDWVFIHPNYRGVFNNPNATGSEPAVRDIQDALEYAKQNANIDQSRIYLVGFSGGAMTALIMAGRYPDLWTAVVAWVPVFNLSEWYPYVLKFPNRHYAKHIVASCGGVPRPGSPAAQECEKRSPSKYLKNARGKKVSIYIGHGINDNIALPGNALQVFNALAEPEDIIPPADIEYIDSKGKLPQHLVGDYSDPLYREAGRPLLFRKTSGNVTVSLFKGGHDVLYGAGLLWLDQQIGGIE